jgi:hypothetical protein
MDVSRFPASIAGAKEGNMSLKLLAIDLGKRSFHCYGIGNDGVIISRKTSRFKLLETINELAPETITTEARNASSEAEGHSGAIWRDLAARGSAEDRQGPYPASRFQRGRRK